ncbi:TonB-dependent hemoglobin/transferrin/lactoferrin family receptor [Deefgea piscis]|uniref:TonB-dependent hemoglobin/transferrin/lactoferrin family receptor n=1 Tax=Deefgea piscis TaxID=2739061 RepID=UPI001C821B3A|nr:TonB-dependent hemoglobin/transferrin/lactoferrin family receptor [Deefgea piscis]QZA82076.1 TonB-dependent hemoglobin/transferrin/lactoferrin family receptor [Deefgea piscis]
MKATVLTLTLISAAMQHAFAAAEPVFPALDPIVVIGTRTEKELSELPPSITTTTRTVLDDDMIDDFRDFSRAEPGVNIRQNGRYGLSSVSIRGLDSNRVLMMVDGIRLPDAFSFGSYLNSGRDQVDFSQLAAIEVLRGPASTLYGSDALGGVVGMRTTNPADLLQGQGDVGGQVKADYASADKSFGAQAAVAFSAGENTLGLVQVAGRRGHEFETMGTVDTQKYGRTTANPQDTEQRSALVKLQHFLDGGHQLGLTAEMNQKSVDTTMYTDIGAPMMSSVKSSRAEDEQTRRRISLDYQYTAPDQNGWIDGAQAMVYRQDMATTQKSFQVRQQGKALTPNWSRTSTYDQDTIGINGLIEKRIAGDIGQHWTLGAEWFQTDLTELRDGTPSSSTLNVRDVPKTKTTQWGIYAQNELSFAGGQFTLTPGLRFDHYQLKPDVDTQFSNGGGQAVALNDSALSPKLAAAWQVSDMSTLFAQYSAGFRAPNAMELNGSYISPMGYAAIANPNLKPETSHGIELGGRFGNSALGGSIAAFNNQYDNFIEQVSFTCPGSTQCVPGTDTTYQNQNISQARIYGAEVRMNWQIGQGWHSWANAAWAVGLNQTNDRPLGSVAPLKAVTGLGYQQAQWGGQLLFTAVKGQDKVAGENDFKAPGYGLVDLIAWWTPRKDLKITGGIFNLGDRKYWIDSDVRGLASSSANMDRLTQPGRNLRLSADWKF